MRKRIVPYPRLNSNEALRRLGAKVTWSLGDSQRVLPYEAISDCQYRITDKTWYPDTCPLRVGLEVVIKSPLRLFDGVHGNEGCAVAERDSLLGVALRWKLPKTNLQGACHCRDISRSETGELRFKASIDFPAMVIRFALELEVVVYLKQCNPERRGFYAKTLGALLGPIDRFVLITGGSGGYFPTVTEKLEGGPLWKVHANINEPEDFNEDFTADFFCLILNELHPLYDKVYVTSRNEKFISIPFAHCVRERD